MDIHLPKLNGFEVVAGAGQTRRFVTSILAATAKALNGDQEKCPAAGWVLNSMKNRLLGFEQESPRSLLNSAPLSESHAQWNNVSADI